MRWAAILFLLLLAPAVQAQANAERVSQAEADQLRARLVGKPVHGAGGGRIGRIEGVAIGPDGSIGAVTVAMDGTGEAQPGDSPRHLPVAWPLIRAQMDNPTIILPWDTATLGWMTGQR